MNRVSLIAVSMVLLASTDLLFATSKTIEIVESKPHHVTYRLAAEGQQSPLPFEIKGFSDGERTHRWTNANQASIKLPLFSEQGQIKIVKFRNASALISPTHSQEVQVFLKDSFQKTYKFNMDSPSQDMEVEFPQELTGEAIISFIIPNACQPGKLDPGNLDPRLLGMLLNLVEVTYEPHAIQTLKSSSSSQEEIKHNPENEVLPNETKTPKSHRVALEKQVSGMMSLDELLAKSNPVAVLEAMVVQNPENVRILCEQIKEPSFYHRKDVNELGPVKRSKIVNFCEGVKLDQGNFKKVVQKAKLAEAEKEVVKLKHVDFSKKGNVEEEQHTLQAAKKIIIENAELLGKKQEVEAQLIQVEEELKQAEEFYNNLSVAIMILRDDMKGITGFQIFNPKAHDQDSPDQYLTTLNDALLKGDNRNLTRNDKEQLEAATKLLNQANENLAKARGDLERINREMLEFTQ